MDAENLKSHIAELTERRRTLAEDLAGMEAQFSEWQERFAAALANGETFKEKAGVDAARLEIMRLALGKVDASVKAARAELRQATKAEHHAEAVRLDGETRENLKHFAEVLQVLCEADAELRKTARLAIGNNVGSELTLRYATGAVSNFAVRLGDIRRAVLRAWPDESAEAGLTAPEVDAWRPPSNYDLGKTKYSHAFRVAGE